MSLTYMEPVFVSGLLAGKTGMIVTMLLTSVLVLGFGVMALRLRSAILNTMGELSSKVVSKFVIPEGGASGSGSMAASLSATGSGGSGGSGGAGGSVASTAMHSAAAGAGSNVGKAVMAGTLGAGAVGVAGKIAGSKDNEEHAFVATGSSDDTNNFDNSGVGVLPGGGNSSVANAQGGDVSSDSSSASMNQAQANAERLTQGAATGGEFVDGSMNAEAWNAKSEKEMGMALMNADSLASASNGQNGVDGQDGRRDVVSGENGPQSGNAYSDAHADGRGADAYADGAQAGNASASANGQDFRGVQAGAANNGVNGQAGVGANGASGVSVSGEQSGNMAVAHSDGARANIRGVQAGAANDKAVNGSQVYGFGSSVETRNGQSGKDGADAYGAVANIRGVSANAANSMGNKLSSQSQMQSYADAGAESGSANVNVPVGASVNDGVRNVRADIGGSQAVSYGSEADVNANANMGEANPNIRGVSANATGEAGKAGANGYGYGMSGLFGTGGQAGSAGANGYGSEGAQGSGSYRQSQQSGGASRSDLRGIRAGESAQGIGSDASRFAESDFAHGSSQGAAGIRGVNAGASGESGAQGAAGMSGGYSGGRGANRSMEQRMASAQAGGYCNNSVNSNRQQAVPVAGMMGSQTRAAGMSGVGGQDGRDGQRGTAMSAGGAGRFERAVSANTDASAANVRMAGPAGSAGASGRVSMGRGGMASGAAGGSYRETSGVAPAGSSQRFAMPTIGSDVRVASSQNNVNQSVHTQGGGSGMSGRGGAAGVSGRTVVNNFGQNGQRGSSNGDDTPRAPGMASPVIGAEPQGDSSKGVQSINGLSGSRRGSAAPGQMIRKNEKQYGSYKNTAGSDDFI